MKALSFVVKHLVAAAALILGTAGLTIALYFGLIAWAVLTNGNLGGPLALPGMVVFAVGVVLSSVILVLGPAASLAQFVRARVLRMNRFAEIPLASAILAVYAGILITVAIAHGWTSGSQRPLLAAFIVLEFILLGAYWWALQATDAFLSFAAKCWVVLRGFASRKLTAV